MKKLFSLAVLAAHRSPLRATLPDIKRYLEMRRM